MAERLAKVRVRFRDVPFGPHVEEPRDADGRVTAKPVGFIARPGPLPLKQVVEQPSGIGDVLAKVINPRPDRFDDDEAIDFGRRLDQLAHDPLVEGIDHAVERFDGVGDRFGQNDDLRIGLARDGFGGRLDGSRW